MRSAILLAPLLLTACAANLGALYDDTRGLTDAQTNFEVAATPLGRPVCERLVPEEGLAALTEQQHRESPVASSFREPAAPQRCDDRSPIVATFPARLESGRPRFTFVNTDLDDTLWPSMWDAQRYPAHHVYPGALELYAAEGQALVLLTARPSAGSLREEVCGYFQREMMSEGCEGIRVSPGELGNVLDSLGMGLVKAEALLRQRCEHPDSATVFHGDSGQGDWIAALIARDLDPTGVPYAAIHDVRAWSPEHARALLAGLAQSERLTAIYRRAVPRAAGEAEGAFHARVAHRVAALRHDIAAALRGPHGRLERALLRARGIYLHRNHAELALDLADLGLLDRRAAERIARVAAPDLCFAPANPFGYDDARSRTRLIERIAGQLAPD